jgi:hypothetical protein
MLSMDGSGTRELDSEDDARLTREEYDVIAADECGPTQLIYCSCRFSSSIHDVFLLPAQ